MGPAAKWPEWDAILDQVGLSKPARLAWVLKRVQENRRGLTAGQRDDLRRELTVFVEEGGGTWDESGLDTPPAEDVRDILDGLYGMLASAVNRERVSIARRAGDLYLAWIARKGGQFVLLNEDDESWEFRGKLALARLLVECGHLLRACPAPSVRGDEGETCNTWFVANRPRQAYCSGTCQSRAATRAFRARTSARTNERAKPRRRRPVQRRSLRGA